MFKKERDLAERSRTLLKNKEARNLRNEVMTQFNIADDLFLGSTSDSQFLMDCRLDASLRLCFFLGGWRAHIDHFRSSALIQKDTIISLVLRIEQ